MTDETSPRHTGSSGEPASDSSPDRITVVFFHMGTEAFGGGSQMLFRLLDRIDKRSIEPIVLTNRRDQFLKEVERVGVESHVVPFKGSLDTHDKGILEYGLFRKAAASMRILQYNVDTWDILRRADVLWCHNIRNLLMMVPYSLLPGTRIIWNIGLGFESSGVMKYLNDIALAVADDVFIESMTQAKWLFTDRQYDWHESKLEVFHKGIDTGKFDPEHVDPVGRINGVAVDRPAVGTAALLHPRKGLNYFLQSIPEVLDDHPETTFYIAGEPPQAENASYKRELEEACAELGIRDDVKFLGWVESMPSYFASLDVFVLPSLNEGISGAVREALSMATPTVATDVGGNSDAVRDEETGLLIEPENPDELSQSVRRLLSDPDFAESLGEAGRSLMIDEFSVDQYVKKYEEFLHDADN